MKSVLKVSFALLVFSSFQTWAATKSCEELKAEIAHKLTANGVKKYQLDIVATADARNSVVIGTCERGSKKIIFKKV